MLAVKDSYRILMSGLSHRQNAFSDAVDALGTYRAGELEHLQRQLTTETIAAQIKNDLPKFNDLERLWEILIAGIGTPDEGLDAGERLVIIRQIATYPPPLPRLRAVKTGLTDAITNLWEALIHEDQMWARGYLELLTTDQDDFIRIYAQEAIAKWI